MFAQALEAMLDWEHLGIGSAQKTNFPNFELDQMQRR